MFIAYSNLTSRFRQQHVISPLFVEEIEEVGDLYLDIAEAYVDVGKLFSVLFLTVYSADTVHLKIFLYG